MTSTRPYESFAPMLALYREACRARGHAPHVIVIRPVYLGEDARMLRDEVEPYLLDFFAFNASPMASLASEAQRAELHAKGFVHYASGAMEALRDVTYEDAVAQDIALVGTPDAVASRLARFAREDAVDEIAIVASFGGLPADRVLRTQQLFAERVIPSLRGR